MLARAGRGILELARCLRRAAPQRRGTLSRTVSKLATTRPGGAAVLSAAPRCVLYTALLRRASRCSLGRRHPQGSLLALLLGVRLLHARGHLGVLARALSQYCPEASVQASLLLAGLQVSAEYCFSLTIRHKVSLLPSDAGKAPYDDDSPGAEPLRWDHRAPWQVWISPVCL